MIEPVAEIAGGRARGAVLHKLIEEILTGEAAESVSALEARAAEFIEMIGQDAVGDPSRGLSAAEIAGTAQRALSLPEIAAVLVSFSTSPASTCVTLVASMRTSVCMMARPTRQRREQ